MSFSLLKQEDFLALGIPPPNGQVQYRHQGNSAGCIPGSVQPGGGGGLWKDHSTHRAAESLRDPQAWTWGRGEIRGPPKIQMPSCFCKPVCGKFVERTNGLEISQERALKTVIFLHYLSIRKPETCFGDIQQIGAEVKDV